MALNAAVQLNVRTDGSDENGGGFRAGATGTDRSLQAAAHATLTTNSTVHTTTTQINVHAGDYTVSAADVGNLLNLGSGGTATPGVYEITAADTANNRWTVDRAAGSAGQTTPGKMGGAYATPGMAGKVLVDAGASRMRVWVKSGTYTLTTTTPGSGGPFLNSARLGIVVEGYSSTLGDRAGRPVLDAGSQTDVVLWNHSFANTNYFIHLSANGRSGTGNKGFALAYSGAKHVDCAAVDCSETSCYGFSAGRSIGCSATNCATGYLSISFAIECGASLCGIGYSAVAYVVNCLASGCTTDGFVLSIIGTALRCTADANGRYGFSLPVASECIDCIATNHSGVGNVGFYTAAAYVSLVGCAGYNNITNASTAMLLNDGFVSLTADPYVNRAAGDFRPNNTAGGGALLRAASIGVYGQTDNRDIGAVQHSDPVSTDPGRGNVESGVAYTINDVATLGTFAVPAESQVEDGVQYGAGGTEFTGTFVGGGGGIYPPTDDVDGGVLYGPTGTEYEGTGMTSAEVESAITTALANGVNVTQVNGADAGDAFKNAAAAAIAAAEPIDANITQVAGVSFAEGVREALGMADADMDDQLDAILAASSPQGGVYTQTVTVKTTGGAAIPNATVAIYSGSVLIDTKTTNSSGIAQPMCDANPAYTLRVTATGYSSSSTSLAVTGDATLADIVLSSSETTITPSADQAKTTAYWIVYGADTMPVGEDDVTATIWIIKMPSDHGAAYVDNPVQTISTTTNGILSATLFKGATYQIALSDGREWVVEVPLKAGTTYKMPPIRVAEA